MYLMTGLMCRLPRTTVQTLTFTQPASLTQSSSAPMLTQARAGYRYGSCLHYMTQVTAVMCFTGDALRKCLLLRHLLKPSS